MLAIKLLIKKLIAFSACLIFFKPAIAQDSSGIDSIINNGVSMITFFGHGSTKGFDYYLNAPKHYTNKDKYPLIMALGCYNGTIFNSNKLISEKFILEDNGGAISRIIKNWVITI